MIVLREDDYEKRSKQFKMRAVSFESYAFISALLFGFSCMAVKWDNGDYTLFRDAQEMMDFKAPEIAQQRYTCTID